MPFAVPFVARPVPVVLLPAASHQSQACGPERCPPGVGALGCHRGTSPCLLRLPASVRARACVCEVERRGRRERACTHTHTQTQTQTHTHTLTLTQTNTHTHTDTHTHTTLYLCFCFDCVCECNVCFLHRHSPHHPLTLADPHDTTAAIKSCAAEDADDGCDVCGG